MTTTVNKMTTFASMGIVACTSFIFLQGLATFKKMSDTNPPCIDKFFEIYGETNKIQVRIIGTLLGLYAAVWLNTTKTSRKSMISYFIALLTIIILVYTSLKIDKKLQSEECENVDLKNKLNVVRLYALFIAIFFVGGYTSAPILEKVGGANKQFAVVAGTIGIMNIIMSYRLMAISKHAIECIYEEVEGGKTENIKNAEIVNTNKKYMIALAISGFLAAIIMYKEFKSVPRANTIVS